MFMRTTARFWPAKEVRSRTTEFGKNIVGVLVACGGGRQAQAKTRSGGYSRVSWSGLHDTAFTRDWQTPATELTGVDWLGIPMFRDDISY
jgi:hypothetical protein